MDYKYSSILLIEANHKERDYIMACLYGVAREVLWASCTSAGMNLLDKHQVDAVLVGLPSKKEMDALAAIRVWMLKVPVIAISEIHDIVLATEVLRSGVQDFLVKGHFDTHLLLRSLHFSIERQRVMGELQATSIFDELTGLYNRRGFLMLANHQQKIAERTGKSMALFFADMDNLKWINDTYGHQTGDEAIRMIGTLLRDTFRSSDIISRFGGDEFVALVLDVSREFADNMIERLAERENAESKWPRVSLSIGFACYDPKKPSSIEELLCEADKLMYEQKRLKKKTMDLSTSQVG